MKLISDFLFHNDLELFIDFYLFDWKNPDQLTNHSSKPVFEELGPYRFRMVRDKLKIEFSDDGEEVNYREIRSV